MVLRGGLQATLYPLIQSTPDYSNPGMVKSYNEILRCFESICHAFSDRLMAFIFLKLEDPKESSRVGNLSVLKHLINSSGKELADKRELVVSGLRPLLGDKSTKVRSVLAQVIIALAHHDYLALEGGQVLVQFVIDQCAVNTSLEKAGVAHGDDYVTLAMLKRMCENVLHLSVTTIPSMTGVLW